jgi:hypothetical protein
MSRRALMRIPTRVLPAVHIPLLVLSLLGLCASMSYAADAYDTQRAAAVRTCVDTDPEAYQSGLLFNPAGYRSYYLRSACFQTAAVEFRDASLCERVRQRHSIVMSSWGYSPANCHKLVAEGVAADRVELGAARARYLEGGMRLRSFRIARNGNGRDFEILPEFSGRDGHSCSLAFEIVDVSPSFPPVTIHSSSYYVDPSSALHIFVRQADIRAKFPPFTVGRPYHVRATAVLNVGTGGSNTHWSSAFIEQVFPKRERSQSVTIETSF